MKDKKTAEEILGKHSKNYGSDIGNPRAIVRATEALAAMEEYASQRQIVEKTAEEILEKYFPLVIPAEDEWASHVIKAMEEYASQKPQGGEREECPDCGNVHNHKYNYVTNTLTCKCGRRWSKAIREASLSLPTDEEWMSESAIKEYQKQVEPETSEFECFFHYTDELLFMAGYKKGFEAREQMKLNP